MRGTLLPAFVSLLACMTLCGGWALAENLSGSHPNIQKIIFPRFEESNETRFPPYIELLKGALEHTQATYGPYELKPSPLPMNSSRSLLELQSGKIDVFWTSTTEERERVLLPVRIPIEKGLLSYRVSLISRSHQSDIDHVLNLNDLRKLKIGQGLGWGDTDVYRYNGIKVIEANYSSLFSMVTTGRFDLFPRGVGEVFDEYAAYSVENPDLTIEKNLVLYYPWPYYFFFNRDTGSHLAKRIDEGLRMMINDGSFDAWFLKHYGKSIRRANLTSRRIIRLKNPFLPKNTPLNDTSLWFNPKTKGINSGTEK